MNEKTTVKRIKTSSLQLTMHELVHIRDLMTIMLPPYGSRTVSASLADAEGRSCIDGSLWKKVSDLCELAGVPTGTSAPDYVISIVEAPTLSVIPINLGEEIEEVECDECLEDSPKDFMTHKDADLSKSVSEETHNGCGI